MQLEMARLFAFEIFSPFSEYFGNISHGYFSAQQILILFHLSQNNLR